MIRRRSLLGGLALGGSGLLLSGCDRLNASPRFRGLLEGAEQLHYRSQRLLAGGGGLAREYGRADMSPIFRTNGSIRPLSPA